MTLYGLSYPLCYFVHGPRHAVRPGFSRPGPAPAERMRETTGIVKLHATRLTGISPSLDHFLFCLQKRVKTLAGMNRSLQILIMWFSPSQKFMQMYMQHPIQQR